MRAFQSPGFQSPGFQSEEDIEITQTLPALTQSGIIVVSDAVVPSTGGEPHFPGERIRKPVRKPVTVSIQQTLPMFTQSLTAEVTDDELVLLFV